MYTAPVVETLVTTTVLFRTTFTRTIILNLIMNDSYFHIFITDIFSFVTEYRNTLAKARNSFTPADGNV